MSTKSTIAHGPGFHFYHEVLDEDHVYLELETTSFEAGYGRVMLPIPPSPTTASREILASIRRLQENRADLRRRGDKSL